MRSPNHFAFLCTRSICVSRQALGVSPVSCRKRVAKCCEDENLSSVAISIFNTSILAQILVQHNFELV